MSESIAPIDQALLPASVRNGDAQRKQDYQAALSFERVLVGQMTEAMTKGFGALGGDDEQGGDAASQQLKQTLPETLADALMAGGGIGLAGQLDELWHPGAAHTSVSKTAAEARQSGGGATTGGSAAA
jgi:Rod binding domain-containing protein